MEGIGWIGALLLGALAGWIAEKIMKADHGLIANVVLGITGALVLNFILHSVLGRSLGGIIGQLIVAVVGACGLIGLARLLFGRG